jgi:hypothetical protein
MYPVCPKHLLDENSVGENGIPTIIVSAHPFKHCQEPTQSKWKKN